MSFFQALFHFLREASLNLARGWRVSVLAVVTIAASLYVGGVFLVLARGVSTSVEDWRGDAKVVVYLEPGTTAARIDEIGSLAQAAPWVMQVETVSSLAAAERFAESFPEISDLVQVEGEGALPPSLELTVAPEHVGTAEARSWLEELDSLSGVAMVDDDRRWLEQVDVFAALLRLLGLVLGAVLLSAAIFTTATVIRLTAHVYRREISVQRLVGGTEFYIRGPFVVEGVLQGLLGGLLAALALGLSLSVLAARGPALLAGGPLALGPVSPWVFLGVVVLGASTGFVGAVLSLRREI